MRDSVELKNLEITLREVINNKGSAGINRKSVEELKMLLNTRYRVLQQRLITDL